MFIRKLSVGIEVLCLATALQTLGGPLEETFQTPPDAAKPLTWWHWLGGSVSEAGITAELEAMKQVGIGGVQMFAGPGSYLGLTQGEMKCLSPEWFERVQYATSECKRLGLSFGMQDCPGWSTAGGPWITPDKNMFHVVTERHFVKGGDTLTLKKPASWPNHAPLFYDDIAVVAFPTPAAYRHLSVLPKPEISASFASTNMACLNRESRQVRCATYNYSPDYVTYETGPDDKTVWIQFAFPEAFTCRSVSITTSPKSHAPAEHTAEVWASEDGQTFRNVRCLSSYLAQYKSSSAPVSHALPATHARVFRLVWKTPVTLKLRRVEWSAEPVVTDLDGQTGKEARTLLVPDTMADEPDTLVDPATLVDLTQYLDTAGTLTWQVPQGDWTVVRVGYRSTGARNAPTAPEASGFECNKFDPEIVAFHFDNYIGRMIDVARRVKSESAIKQVVVDSWEAHTQNWTPKFRDEFKKRREYDLFPYLPAYAGFIVSSRDVTRRYFRDARQTGSDLVSENFFGTLRTCAARHGMKLYCQECSGNGSGTMTADAMQPYLYVDVPMAGASPERFAASAAHVTGAPVVARETHTQGGANSPEWGQAPYNLKSIEDSLFTFGINQIVFHTYAHNPFPERLSPGPAFGRYGMPFSRGQTWWPYAKEWIHYLTRCQAMLQKGRAIADVLCFYGEEPAGQLPNVLEDNQNLPGLPVGYSFDFMPPMLLPQMDLFNGRAGLKTGSRYRLLVLKNANRMTPQTARELKRLVKGGLSLLGPRPSVSPSLSDYPACDAEVQKICAELWGLCDGKQVTENLFGKGHVFCGIELAEALKRLQLRPDLTFAVKTGGPLMSFIHRQTEEADVYFLANRSHQGQIDLTFRVSDRCPEIWDPVTGQIDEAPAFKQVDDQIHLSLNFARYQSLFVVFRNPLTSTILNQQKDRVAVDEKTIELKGPWTVAFNPQWDAPASITFPTLQDWTCHTNSAIKYYSGTGSYKTIFTWEGNPKQRVRLDLGAVRSIAEVVLNNTPCGIAWTFPFAVDITSAIKNGDNTLEVNVANTWANRLIGDQRLPPEKRRTWTTHHVYTKDTPVENYPSGLLGPVTIISCP